MVLTESIPSEKGGGTPRCGTECGYVHSATGSNSFGFLFIFYESVEAVSACVRAEDICCIIGVPLGCFEERATINSLGSYPLASIYLYGVSFICKITCFGCFLCRISSKLYLGEVLYTLV